MPENFEAFDSEGAPGGQEAAGESDEKFREQYRKNQAAIKKIKKQEGKKKAQDNTLAHIIVQFLSDPRFTRFFLLISRIVSRNVPSDLILAILALIHKESAKAIDEKKLELPGKVEEPEAGKFPPHLKAQMNHWMHNITAVGTAEPHKALETMLDHDWNLDPNIVELFAAVLQQFMVFQKEDVPPMDNLRSFGEGFFTKLVSTLESQVNYQNLLGGQVDEDFEDEAVEV